MINLLELAFGRYNGGQAAPIGSYLNPRTMCVFQQTSDGALPQCGTFVRVDASGSQTLANIAISVNAILNTAYVAGSFHAYTSGDNISTPGMMTNDA
jgi:hypothetical protein